MKHALFILLGFLVLSLKAHAEDVVILSDYLKAMDNVTGQFVQHTYDGKGSLLQTQKGV